MSPKKAFILSDEVILAERTQTAKKILENGGFDVEILHPYGCDEPGCEEKAQVLNDKFGLGLITEPWVIHEDRATPVTVFNRHPEEISEELETPWPDG